MFLCRDIVTFSRVEESSGSMDSPKTNEQFEQSLAVWVEPQGTKGEPTKTKESLEKLQKPRRKSVVAMVTFSVTAWENFRP